MVAHEQIEVVERRVDVLARSHRERAVVLERAELQRGVVAHEAVVEVDGPREVVEHGRVGTAVLGAVPGHPAFVRAARLSRPGVTIFGAPRFYPYRWDEPEKAGGTFPDAYTAHHWATSWTGTERAS